MKKETLMKQRPHPGIVKSRLIHNILNHNKIAQDLFNIEELCVEELYEMKISELRSVDAELRIQIGFKRSFRY